MIKYFPFLELKAFTLLYSVVLLHYLVVAKNGSLSWIRSCKKIGKSFLVRENFAKSLKISLYIGILTFSSLKAFHHCINTWLEPIIIIRSNLSSWTDPLKNLRRQWSSGDKLRMIYSSLSVNGHSYAKFHYSLAIPYWYLHSSRTRIFRPQSQIGLSSDLPLVMQVFTRGDEPDCPETHFLLWFFFFHLL